MTNWGYFRNVGVDYDWDLVLKTELLSGEIINVTSVISPYSSRFILRSKNIPESKRVS